MASTRHERAILQYSEFRSALSSAGNFVLSRYNTKRAAHGRPCILCPDRLTAEGLVNGWPAIIR